jgi:hypothetical protein
MKPFLCTALFAACVVLRAGAAAASPPKEAVALRRFIEGRQAFEAGRFEEALAAFQASIELQPSPNSRLYIGRCYRALGRTASAYTSFRLAAREAEDRLKATGERRYTATRATALGEAAEIEPKVPHVTLAVPAQAPGQLAITVDGDELPSSAWGVAIELDPGRHDIAATGPRLRPFAAAVELLPGDSRRVDVLVERIPTATLRIDFETRPEGLSVEIDGRPVATLALEQPLLVDVGPHRVVARAPGHADYVWAHELADRDEVALRVSLGAARTGTPRWLFYAAAGGAGAALAAGSVLAIRAEIDARGEHDKDPLLRDPATLDRIGRDRTTSAILFAAGAALGVTAGVLLFTTRWGEPGPRPRAALAPWAGAGVLGLDAVVELE